MSLMRVAWLNEAPIVKNPDGSITGGLASVRYRCIIPQAQLKPLGVESFLFGRIDKAAPAALAEVMDKTRPDVAVIGKVFGRHVLDLVPVLQQRGIKVVIDFCDNHFNRPETGDVHRGLVAAADAVVAATPMMAEAITQATGAASTLIPDPYEGPHGAPRFAPAEGRPLQLLWFGGRTNVDTIGPCLPALNRLAAQQPLALTIFTDPVPALEQLIASAKTDYPAIAEIRFQPWSLDGQWRAIAACDAVIIPSLDNETKNVKGPNRLIEAIRGGRAVAAFPLPSYLAFKDVCWLDRDIGAALEAMLADPAAVTPRIAAGQDLVERLHGQRAIAGLWKTLFEGLAATRREIRIAPTAAPDSDAAFKSPGLNVGHHSVSTEILVREPVSPPPGAVLPRIPLIVGHHSVSTEIAPNPAKRPPLSPPLAAKPVAPAVPLAAPQPASPAFATPLNVGHHSVSTEILVSGPVTPPDDELPRIPLHVGHHSVSTDIAPAKRPKTQVNGASHTPAAIPAAELPKIEGPIRLNLGCGDKILKGYVNIDLVDERAGHKPDIMCDVRKLTLPDGYADEAMAIHVVEHFWRWEVVDILKEWGRVLKPGGKIILECPNLLSACEAVLRNPEGATGPGKEGQRSMWVLYGDPAWKDPLMCHRWAYTPQSLAAVMQEAGFAEIRQEPAQFKLREPRDMRIVGVKPGVRS
jgi:SAM-dependent methyltransferase